ncbi:MAG TPA: DNA methyltransferase, partial [Smithellaceae bacterium]|nr:DNA methyltransferase [Smithellaceae bacterium]
WANADQYYIKTSEYLKDYSFKLPGGKKAHFKLVEATQEKDNIKAAAGKERKFKLHEDEPIQIEGQEVFIRFVYLPEKEKQDTLNKKTIELVNGEATKRLKDFPELFAAAPTAKNANRTLWEKHLTSYTARFNFDFFIHKDLGGFLRRELDFYIKNEVLYVDDLDGQDERQLKSAVAKIKVIKHIALKIIAFLAQLEDFQKKLWLKKKFVVNCGYCVTLDRVPEELYPVIAQNENQREEWIKLFAIDEIEADLSKPGYSKPLTVEFLKANPYLVLDTKHFDGQFQEKLLASFDNLDDATDGVIINSENFQALNLLQEKYREKVKCTYIDPPYNSESSEIIYKNSYKHSSWITLMADRLKLLKAMQSATDCLIVAIDENEQERLGSLIESLYPNYLKTCVSVIHNPGGIQGDNFSYCHESAYFIYPDKKGAIGKIVREEADEVPLRDWGGDESKRDTAANCFYPIFVKNNEILDFGDVCSDDYHPKSANISRSDGVIEIYPIDGNGIERKWRNARDTVGEIKGDLFCKEKDGIISIIRKKTVYRYKTVWQETKYNANTYGSKLLGNIIGLKKFDFPKSIYTVVDSIDATTQKSPSCVVLDFFGGSGTTAHALIHMQRENRGKRKYILVEMGEYFDTVLKPRIQKVVYSKDWKDGKPVSREGISHMFKYMYLESYDDTLDNLRAVRTEDQETLLEKMSAGAREDYTLSYMLNVETKASDSLLNIDRFRDPFNYTLKIRRDNELKDEKIDLVETFNYLIGLYVEQTETIRGFKVVRGKLRTGEKTLVIWRNTQEKSNEALDEFFQKQKYNTLDFEFDLIFVNGDNNLENLKVGDEKWKVRLIEEEFKKRMFAEDV